MQVEMKRLQGVVSCNTPDSLGSNSSSSPLRAHSQHDEFNSIARAGPRDPSQSAAGWLRDRMYVLNLNSAPVVHTAVHPLPCTLSLIAVDNDAVMGDDSNGGQHEGGRGGGKSSSFSFGRREEALPVTNPCSTSSSLPEYALLMETLAKLLLVDRLIRDKMTR